MNHENNNNGFNMIPLACAACKHQRKRCDQHCVLAKYFPAERAEDFQNVHRLFGVNNVLRILNSVEVNERDKTAETLILEAKIRRENPVLGPIEIERMLQAEIVKVQKELEIVNKQLHFFKGSEGGSFAVQEGSSSDQQVDFWPLGGNYSKVKSTLSSKLIWIRPEITKLVSLDGLRRSIMELYESDKGGTGGKN
ncbi:hypothetical protein BUALT_Bualt09G0033200 [Buddleja alternifolia]|uniref:LOB domain-containing protein n=1 Tax=Buddleja alternifolia TaxID=168488 RepID=A0AAV6X1C3_9LAMI|nr:hypothetical protein BUALT_Bualt09G0033200 [Buddleja alternifolia]